MNVVPICRRYEWRYGLVDGAPPEARARFPIRLTKPPTLKEGEAGSSAQPPHAGRGWIGGIRAGRHASDEDALDAAKGGAADPRAGHRDRDSRGRRNNDNGDTHQLQEEETLRRQLLQRRWRASSRASRGCKDTGLAWHREDDDDDMGDDQDPWGKGLGYSDDYWGIATSGRRDRTCSPPRRDYSAPTGCRHNAAHFRALFTNTISLISSSKVTNPLTTPTSATRSGDTANRFYNIIDKLEDDLGNEAWSEPVPASRVFNKLRMDLRLPAAATPRGPTVEDINTALDVMLRRLPHLHIDNDGAGVVTEGEDAALQSCTPTTENDAGNVDATPTRGLTDEHAPPGANNDDTPEQEVADNSDNTGIDALFCPPAEAELGSLPLPRLGRQPAPS
nr:unnamed protein product [Digitaria exilis]